MGFWTKDKQDSESARRIPQEQMTQQRPQTKESTLTSVPIEDYDVIENDENLKEKEPSEANLPSMPSSNLRFQDTSNESLDDKEAKLYKQLEDLKEEKTKLLENQRLKEQSLDEATETQYQPQAIYLTDAECLREILRKLDYLIVEINNKLRVE